MVSKQQSRTRAYYSVQSAWPMISYCVLGLYTVYVCVCVYSNRPLLSNALDSVCGRLLFGHRPEQVHEKGLVIPKSDSFPFILLWVEVSS